MLELLKKLISINSVSGNEEEIIGFISNFLNENSVEHKKIGNNIVVELGKGQKTLCIVAHVDTVPVTDGWLSDPFNMSIKNDKIFGLGSVDNKASVSILLELIFELQEIDFNGKIIFVFTSEEESTMNGIETVQPHIKPDSAIICEPTNLVPCTAQKGFVKLKLKIKGKNSHAAFPWKGDNAIYNMIKELEKIKNITFEKEYPLLGYPTISPTLINGGIKHNIIPDTCEVIFDIRTT
ncbi:MAG TPA: M20 family peptidase, partial [Ignavibacteria bacterium]|nr:M20 family peptidase [Ignavibacteria bacterium]